MIKVSMLNSCSNLKHHLENMLKNEKLKHGDEQDLKPKQKKLEHKSNQLSTASYFQPQSIIVTMNRNSLFEA